MSRAIIFQDLTRNGWVSASEISEKLNFLDLLFVNRENSIRLTEDVEAGLLLITLTPVRDPGDQGEFYFWVAPLAGEQESRFCEILESRKGTLTARSVDDFVGALDQVGIRSHLNYPNG